MGSPQATAGSRPRDAAQRAADILTVLDGPDDDCLERLSAVLAEHGEPARSRPTRADLPGLRTAGHAVRGVFAATDTAAAAAAVNAVLARYASPPRITDHAGTAWHLHVDRSDDGDWGEWFAASSALALAVLLTDRQAPPGRICAAPGCGAPFVAHGPGVPRRYCSARCATRMRVARHRGG